MKQRVQNLAWMVRKPVAKARVVNGGRIMDRARGSQVPAHEYEHERDQRALR